MFLLLLFIMLDFCSSLEPLLLRELISEQGRKVNG